MDASFALADNLVEISYEDLPADARQMTKRCILDTLGVMLAGSTAEKACKEVVKMVKDIGGKEESSIIAYGGKVPAMMAVFANGSMSHAVDYDDVHDSANCHPSGSTIPAALAIAERVGGVNGKEFITAVALGIDVVCRLGSALPKSPGEYGFFLPPVLGTFSSTAAAAKLLGLKREQIVSAFGIAIHQAAGSQGMATDAGCLIRAIRDAFSGRNGVLSALMARRGITGVENSLGGEYGLFNLYFKGEYNPATITKDLGKVFLGTTVSFKPWPSCRISHSYINATLELVREHDIKPGDVEEITAVVGDTAMALCKPIEEKRKPKLGIHAKLSIPFTISVAVSQRQVVLGDFLPERLKDPEIHRIVGKVNYQYDPQLDAANHSSIPAIVIIKTENGRQYSKKVEYAYGHPRNPLSMDDLIIKFRDCASYSVRPISAENIEKIIELVTRLEDVSDVNQVIQLVS
jgi:2-methylcitrate dehydratase PrpD